MKLKIVLTAFLLLVLLIIVTCADDSDDDSEVKTISLEKALQAMEENPRFSLSVGWLDSKGNVSFDRTGILGENSLLTAVVRGTTSPVFNWYISRSMFGLSDTVPSKRIALESGVHLGLSTLGISVTSIVSKPLLTSRMPSPPAVNAILLPSGDHDSLR